MLYYAIGLFVQYFSKSFGVNLQTFRCNSNLESNPRYDTSTYIQDTNDDDDDDDDDDGKRREWKMRGVY